MLTRYTALGSFYQKAADCMVSQVIFLELAISSNFNLIDNYPCSRQPCTNVQRGTSDYRFSAKARIVLEGKKGIILDKVSVCNKLLGPFDAAAQDIHRA